MKDIVQGHRTIALDTSIWIYHFENHPTYHKSTTDLLRRESHQSRARFLRERHCLMDSTMKQRSPVQIGDRILSLPGSAVIIAPAISSTPCIIRTCWHIAACCLARILTNRRMPQCGVS